MHPASPPACRRLALAVALSHAAAAAAPAGATVLSWNNPSGGPAATPANWTPALSPGPGDELVFPLAAAYTVTFGPPVGACASLAFRAGRVVATLDAPLSVSGGIEVGPVAGDSATARISSDVLTTGDVEVGATGVGRLDLLGFGHLVATGSVRAGAVPGGDGTIAVGSAPIVSSLTASGLLAVGGDDGPAAGGRGRLEALANGTVTVHDRLVVGDVHGGLLSTLRLDGGTVHARTVVVDSLTGTIDYDAGTLRVDGGALDVGVTPLVVTSSTTTGSSRLEVIRGAAGQVKRDLTLTAALGKTTNLLVDSGASLVVPGILTASVGGLTITVDSSATLAVGTRLDLAGTNGTAALSVGPGGLADVAALDATKGIFASSTITVSGTNARLRLVQALNVGGGESILGGPCTVTLSSGGAITSAAPTSRMRVRAPGIVILEPGGTATFGERVTVEGRLRVDGGTLAVPEIQLAGSGRLEARGPLAARIAGTAATTTIAALGDLDLGDPSSAAGVAFGGTLRTEAHAVRLHDADAIALGDSTLLGGGTLDADHDLSLGSGRVLAGWGTVEASTWTNGGTVAVGDAAARTLAVTGAYVQGAGGTLALDVSGSEAGNFDRLVATGPVTVGGTLRVTFPSGAALVPGVAIPLVTGASRSGTFTSVVFTGHPHPETLTIELTATQVLLVPVPAVGVDPPAGLPRRLALRGGGGPGRPEFRLELPRAAAVRVDLYDAAGRRVVTLAAGALAAGVHRIEVPAGARRGRGVRFGRASVRFAGGGEPHRVSDRIVLD